MMIRSVGLPCLNGYAEALAHYENTKPLRSGRAKGKRPLGDNRRYYYCQIDKVEETGALVMSFCGHDVLEYRTDGTIRIAGDRSAWVSTRQFISAVLPIYTVTKFDRGRFYIGISEVEKETQWYLLRDDEPLILKNKEVLNPLGENAYKINTPKFKEVKAKYGAFREYVRNMGLVTSRITKDEVAQVAEIIGTHDKHVGKKIAPLLIPSFSSARYHGREGLIDRLRNYLVFVEKAIRDEDLDAMYNHFVHLGVSALTFNYQTQAYEVDRYWNDRRGESPIPIGHKMQDYFDEILKHIYKEEIFTTISLPHGKTVSNTNRKYFE